MSTRTVDYNHSVYFRDPEDDLESVSSSSEASLPEEVSAEEGQGLESRVEKVAQRSFGEVAKDFLRSAVKSRVLRAVVLTVGAAVALFFLASNPFGWCVALFGLSLALTSLTYLVAMAVMRKKLYFETSALMRILGLKGPNHHEILLPKWDTDHAKIYLGALPNEFWHREGEFLLNQRKIGALLSINENWEREHLGFSMPYSDDYWKTHLGEEQFRAISSKDHGLLSIESMDEAADFIHDQIEAGRNVYVHCRAGQGRSSTAIAAYLIKWGMHDGAIEYSATLDDICKILKDSREIATINNKMPALVQYCNDVRNHGYTLVPSISEPNRKKSEKYWAKHPPKKADIE